MKNQKYYTVGTVSNSNRKNTTLSEHFQTPIVKIVETGKIDTPYTHIHDHSLSWLGTDTSIKCGGDKLV